MNNDVGSLTKDFHILTSRKEFLRSIDEDVERESNTIKSKLFEAHKSNKTGIVCVEHRLDPTFYGHNKVKSNLKKWASMQGYEISISNNTIKLSIGENVFKILRGKISSFRKKIRDFFSKRLVTRISIHTILTIAETVGAVLILQQSIVFIVIVAMYFVFIGILIHLVILTE